jgi:hypothetical protein
MPIPILVYKMGNLLDFYFFLYIYAFHIFKSNECRCDTRFGTEGLASNCSMTCAGNSTQICGARDTNSIYQITCNIYI